MCTIVQWEDVMHLGGATVWDMQAIIYDTGNVLMQYPPGLEESGDGGTIGIENETPSSIGLDYACNTTATITDNRTVLFCAPGNTCPFVAVVAAPAIAVPTLSQWYLLFLSILLLATGFFVYRYNRN